MFYHTKSLSHLYVHLRFAVNTLRPTQDGNHIPDDIFKCILLNENAKISIKISLKFVPKAPINNIPALIQIMARRRRGDKPLSEPMIVFRRIYASLGLNEFRIHYHHLRHCFYWRHESTPINPNPFLSGKRQTYDQVTALRSTLQSLWGINTPTFLSRVSFCRRVHRTSLITLHGQAIPVSRLVNSSRLNDAVN